MAREGTSLSYSKATVQGQTVQTSNKNTVMASASNSISTSTINVGSTGIGGKKILTACNITTAGSHNGVAAVAATGTFTFISTYADLVATHTPSPPRMEIEAPTGEVRRFVTVPETGVSSATWTYSDEAVIGNEITLLSLGDDGATTTSKTYLAAVVGTASGTLSGPKPKFATYDSTASSAGDKAEDAATNIVAAINHTNGHAGYLEAYANVVSRTDSTAAQGKVVVYQTVPETNGDTAIVHTADVGATTTLVGIDTLAGEDGTNFILTNTDGSTVTFHTDPAKNFGDTVDSGGDHTWVLNTGGDFSSAGIRKATQALWIACKTAIDASELDMTIAPATVDTIADGSQVNFTLTQTGLGVLGNKPITSITGITASAAFTGGLGTDGTTSVNVPANFSSGADPTADTSQGEVSIGGSARWTASQFAAAINSASAGVPGITASSAAAVVTLTASTAGDAGNDFTIDVNAQWDNVSASLPSGTLTGGLDAVTPKMGIEYSIDGTNWSVAETIISDLAVLATGLKYGTVTIPDAVPYARLVFNTLETTVGTGVVQQLQFVS